MTDKRRPRPTALVGTSLLAAPEAFVSPSHAPEALTETALASDFKDTKEIAMPTGESTELWGRWRLWEIPSFYHWSILGLCLSPSELSELVQKMSLVVPSRVSSYELYGLFVELARERGARGQLLNHTLDAKYETILEEFHLKASNEDQALELWASALASGDIPSAYWALMTHPATGPSAYQRAFKDLQMVSLRLVAAGGAPIGWLQQLERELREVKEEHAHVEKRLREQLQSKDTTIASLSPIAVGASTPNSDEEVERLRAQVAALEWRVVLESEWAKGSQTRSTGLVNEMQALKERLAASEQENSVLRWAYKEARAKLLKTNSDPSNDIPLDPTELSEPSHRTPRENDPSDAS